MTVDEAGPAEMGADLARAVEALRSGGVVVFPTDTLYGLGALVENEDAVARVARIKGRERGRGIPVLLAGPDQAGLVVTDSPLLRMLAERFWPGALTVVADARPGIAEVIKGPSATVGVRVPDLELTRRLIARAGGPITGTSANATGQPPASTAIDARQALGRLVDYILDGGAARGTPSTVLNIAADPPTILRQGAVTEEEIREVLPGVVGAAVRDQGDE